MNNDQSQGHLAKLWQESSQELAVAFLQRAIRLDASLCDLLATLEYPHLHVNLESIRLRDVLGAPARAETPSFKPAAVSPLRSLDKSRNKRRRPQQTSQIKDLLLQHIRAHDGGIRTPELSAMLQTKGFDVDTATANLILKSMEEGQQIVGDEGRPRLWRAKTVGRTRPEPVVIRRAPDATVGAPLQQQERKTAPQDTASLLSQSEVQAAAAALRERFFATK